MVNVLLQRMARLLIMRKPPERGEQSGHRKGSEFRDAATGRTEVVSVSVSVSVS
jgi:hypothetical protein